MSDTHRFDIEIVIDEQLDDEIPEQALTSFLDSLIDVQGVYAASLTNLSASQSAASHSDPKPPALPAPTAKSLAADEQERLREMLAQVSDEELAAAAVIAKELSSDSTNE